MNLQYISDKKGQKTAVIIPIKDWQQLTDKYNIEQEKPDGLEVPEWQKKIVLERVRNSDHSKLLNWDDVKDNFKLE
jgi:hypothetical protein